MSGKPDLTIHTLTHFLDRFVYRTPKASAAPRGASIMQPLAGGDARDRLVEAAKAMQQSLPLNTEAFWKKQADEVAAEDVFFHEYFNRVNKDKDKVRSKNDKGAQDPVARAEEDGEDLSDNESEIWKALVDSRPELEADEDSDDDLDMDDLESDFDYDEDEQEEGDGASAEVIFNDESDEPSDEEMVEPSDLDDAASPPPATTSKKAAQKASKDVEQDVDEEDDFDMDVSDDEAFVDSDEDLPSDMELGGVGLAPAADAQSERKKRRKLKHLPTFASADDYGALLADEDEGL